MKVELAYDGDGNTERRTLLPGQAGTLETRYAWDGAGRMIGIQQGPVSTPTKETQITYDGLSRRVRLVEKVNGAVTSDKRYMWSGLRLLEERDAAGTTTLRRFYEEGEQRIGGADAGSYYYFRDHLGSVREMVSDTGVLRVRYNYSLYGERTKATGDLDTEMGYTGHWFHSASGLHFAPYRTYDAELGRWLSRDPIGEEGGINLYGYVANNPINLIDSLGLDFDRQNNCIRRAQERYVGDYQSCMRSNPGNFRLCTATANILYNNRYNECIRREGCGVGRPMLLP